MVMTKTKALRDVRSPGQGCSRREGASEAAPEAVRQAVGGGCPSGWRRLLSVTNAIEAGTWRLVCVVGGGGGLAAVAATVQWTRRRGRANAGAPQNNADDAPWACGRKRTKSHMTSRTTASLGAPPSQQRADGTGADLPLASAGSDMIGWGRVLLSHTLDAARSY